MLCKWKLNIKQQTETILLLFHVTSFSSHLLSAVNDENVIFTDHRRAEIKEKK